MPITNPPISYIANILCLNSVFHYATTISNKNGDISILLEIPFCKQNALNDRLLKSLEQIKIETGLEIEFEGAEMIFISSEKI